MKIAIPMVDGSSCLHFGHCEQFALVKVDAEAQKITETAYLVPPAHEPGAWPRWLHEQGVNVVIAGGMGQRAHALFAQNGIKVIVGVSAATPESIVTAYLSGTLQVGQNVCDH